MQFATLKHSVFAEMAAMQHHRLFEPDAQVWAISGDEGEKMIYGRLKGQKVKDLYDTSGRLVPPRRPGAKKPMTIPQVLKLAKEHGYKLVTSGKPTGKISTYATGPQKEGTVGTYTGTVYHGTPNLLFFRETYQRSDFGGGSHLQSLNDHDAFSITPNFKVAADFAEGGMIIEYTVHEMKVYYASRDEDDFDEIEFPDDVHAVAIPHGQYEEDEFAVINDDGFLVPKFVHLKVKGKWKKYNVGQVELYGEENTFLEQWLYDLFGSDFKDILDRYDDINRHIVDEHYESDQLYYVKIGRVAVYLDDPPYFIIDDDKKKGVDEHGKTEYKSAEEFMNKPTPDWNKKKEDDDE